MLTPTTAIPALLDHYRHSKEPLKYAGRFMGVLLSEAYADTRAVKNYWGHKWLGAPHAKKKDAWIRPPDKSPPQPEIRSCDYSMENIALQLGFTQGIMDDLQHLSSMTYVMLLPEKSIALDDPEHTRRWAEHVKTHRQLAAERPWIEIIDLTQGGASTLRDFRDDLHVARRAFGKQRRVFENELEALGVSIDRKRARAKKKRKKAKRKTAKTKRPRPIKSKKKPSPPKAPSKINQLSPTGLRPSGFGTGQASKQPKALPDPQRRRHPASKPDEPHPSGRKHRMPSGVKSGSPEMNTNSESPGPSTRRPSSDKRGTQE